MKTKTPAPARPAIAHSPLANFLPVKARENVLRFKGHNPPDECVSAVFYGTAKAERCKFVERCCNQHAGLVEALEKTQGGLLFVLNALDADEIEDSFETVSEAYDKASAALALARQP